MIYQPERFKELKLYKNSVNIEITAENEFIFSFKMDSIPNVVNILYCDVTDVIDLFNTFEGGVLIQKVYSNDITLNIFPVDTTYINQYEKEYLIGHESLFKRPNVNFYQNWYDPDISFKFHIGSQIHEAIQPFLKKYKTYSFDFNTKSKHFLTLNNYHTPHREHLFSIYNDLSEVDKKKFICSFKFNGVHLENESEDFNDIVHDYNLCFGKTLFPLYEHSLMEIVCESSNVAITEKSMKPLLAGIPFIYGIGFDGERYHNQIEFFNQIGIDTSYFGIDYRDESNIHKKIKELLSLNLNEIQTLYKSDFEKANENKIKVLDWIDTIEHTIIKK